MAFGKSFSLFEEVRLIGDFVRGLLRLPGLIHVLAFRVLMEGKSFEKDLAFLQGVRIQGLQSLLPIISPTFPYDIGENLIDYNNF